MAYYAGTLGGKLAVRLYLLPVDTAVYGDYYYGAHGAGLALLRHLSAILPGKTAPLLTRLLMRRSDIASVDPRALRLISWQRSGFAPTYLPVY